jgi:hypothetical protein
MVVFNIKAPAPAPAPENYNEAVSADYWTGKFVNFNEIDVNDVNTLKSNTDLNEMFIDIASFQAEPVWEALANDDTDFIGAVTTTNPIPNVEFRQIGVIELLSGNKMLAFESERINELTGDANTATSFLGQVSTRLKDLGEQDIRDKILNTVNEPIPFLTCFGYVITRNLLTQYNTNLNSSQIRIGVVFVQESSVQA